MIIIVDGIDKCGKNAVIDVLHKKTNYRHVIINRFLASNFCYGKFHKRKLKYDEYIDYDKQLSSVKFIKQIILFCNKKELIKRFKKHNEKDIQIKDIDELTKLYKEYSQKTWIPTLLVDTSDLSLDVCVSKIIKWLKKQDAEKRI